MTTLMSGLLVIPSVVELPVSAAKANVGMGSGTIGPISFDQSLSPIALTARTRNQYWVPLTTVESMSVTSVAGTLIVVGVVNVLSTARCTSYRSRGVPSLVDGFHVRCTRLSSAIPTSPVGIVGTSTSVIENVVVPSGWLGSSGLPARSVTTFTGDDSVVRTTEIS